MRAIVAAAVLVCALPAATWGDREPLLLTVDARDHCIGLAEGVMGQATAGIPSGRYKVTVESSASYCAAGCSVSKVAFYVTTDDQPKGWFFVVAEGKPIDITVSGEGFEANTVRAFFVDALCEDNSGRAVLVFRRC